MFKIDQTLLGTVVRSREPLVVPDMEKAAPDYLDANVLFSSGFRSALITPLVSKGRAVGTLNVVSRAPDVYQPAHATALQGIAEILAVAVTAQQLQIALGRQRSTEAMSEMTLAVATEINSALQTIIGHCDLLEREYPDPNLQRDLVTVVRQAQRIQDLLEKMRTNAAERLREVEAATAQAGIPSSPEAYGNAVRREPS
jgi:GAF domain-containing protein